MVDDFMHEFGQLYPETELTLVDTDSASGSATAGTYDVVRYPTVVAASNSGTTLQRWDNGMMPLMQEVAYYANQ